MDKNKEFWNVIAKMNFNGRGHEQAGRRGEDGAGH